MNQLSHLSTFHNGDDESDVIVVRLFHGSDDEYVHIERHWGTSVAHSFLRGVFVPETQLFMVNAASTHIVKEDQKTAPKLRHTKHVAVSYVIQDAVAQAWSTLTDMDVDVHCPPFFYPIDEFPEELENFMMNYDAFLKLAARLSASWIHFRNKSRMMTSLKRLRVANEIRLMPDFGCDYFDALERAKTKYGMM
jgi:hypothetical protein